MGPNALEYYAKNVYLEEKIMVHVKTAGESLFEVEEENKDPDATD